ncbi:Rpn family recombination-promoting nuclease/putative transposase [Shouchella lonarensis]|uniref:Transposase, YhgA-like n=1 Tax=Shouchella lonarensis TaxID=1464122 RepID=A0A1G6KP35_9BACI|nr:Rpn family recombination-promoting nuclease/putative transposase [Shouchella lonarensis]SDC32810.1 Putative transposase, YhgA-like [Shouchella lonarensis]
MTPPHPPHDQLFRQLFDYFFADFMKAFFPKLAASIDLHSLEPLSTDAWFSGEQDAPLRPDFVVKTRLKSEDVVILVHVEAQSSYDPNFQHRMYSYHARLIDRYKCPILPIAIFSYDTPGKEPLNEIVHIINGHTYFSFRYESLFLRKLAWRDFINMENAATAALLSKMGYNEGEKVACKKTFLRLLMKLELKEAHRHFVMQFFDSYLILTNEEEMALEREVRELKPDESVTIADFMTSYERRGWEKGRVETAERMLEEGLDLMLIVKVTGLSQKKVCMLKARRTAE